MLAPLLAACVAFLLWRFFSPTLGWTSSFARLLERPATRTGLPAFLTGRETAGGHFDGRTVLLAMQHKRGRHGTGYLTVAMKVSTDSEAMPDALARVGSREAQEALADLARDDLRVSCDEGWLTVRWQPSGFTIFPGRFDDARWRRILRAMSVVADAIDAPLHTETPHL